jgi:hypothetical protein
MANVEMRIKLNVMNKKRERERESCSLDGGRGARTTSQREQTDRVAGRKEGRRVAQLLASFTVVVVVESIFCRNEEGDCKERKASFAEQLPLHCIAHVAKKLASETPIGWQEVDRLPTKAISQRTIRPLCHLLIINFLKVTDRFSYASRL